MYQTPPATRGSALAVNSFHIVRPLSLLMTKRHAVNPTAVNNNNNNNKKTHTLLCPR